MPRLKRLPTPSPILLAAAILAASLSGVSVRAEDIPVRSSTVLLDGSERSLRIYHVGSRQIWGLTARILQNLLARLGLEPLDPELEG